MRAFDKSSSIATRKPLELLLTVEEQAPGAASPPPADNHHWAEMMRRSFGIDVLACPRCGGSPHADRDRGGSGGDRADPAPSTVAGDDPPSPVPLGRPRRSWRREPSGCRRRNRAPRPPPVSFPARLVRHESICRKCALRTRSACLVVRRGTRSSLTIASRANMVRRIRPHGAAGRGEPARGQSPGFHPLLRPCSHLTGCGCQP